MLAAYTEAEKQNSAFTLIGAGSLLTSAKSSGNELSANSLLSSEGSLDSCSFASIFSEPTDSQLMTFAESSEACGAIAYSDSESCGSIAFAGGESCGSIASAGGFSSGASSFNGGCSYSC